MAGTLNRSSAASICAGIWRPNAAAASRADGDAEEDDALLEVAGAIEKARNRPSSK